MERDALEGHGCSWFVKDRLMEQSDETRVWLCRICGLPALVMNHSSSSSGSSSSSYTSLKKECRVCESNDVVLVRMPYATKLLMQTFSGLNILIRCLVDPHTPMEKTQEKSSAFKKNDINASLYVNNKNIGNCKVEIEE